MDEQEFRGSHVLLVDDSRTMIALIRPLLEEEGYRVSEASTAGAALQLVRQDPPHLVLSDVVMPDMDGYQLCKALRSHPHTGLMAIILLTSRGQLEDKMKGFEAGADDYVTKPFNAEELKARIRAQLRLKTLQDRLSRRNDELKIIGLELEDKVEALEAANHKLARMQRAAQRELTLASKVQQELIPKRAPDVSGYEIRSLFRPESTVGGDFFDFIPLENDRLGVAIGDVSGKGVPASLLMALMRTLLVTQAPRAKSPARLLESLNRLFQEQYGGGDSVTLFYGILDPRENSFHFASGGHEFPILFNRSTGTIRELGVGGPFLGIFPGPCYSEGKVYLDRGDRLLLFTDGVLDSCFDGPVGRHPLKLYELIEANRGLDAAALLSVIEGRKGSGAKQDDLTAIVVDTSQPRRGNELAWLRLDPDPQVLRELRPFTQAMAGACGLPSSAVFDLTYAVDEVAANAIVHAYGKDLGGFPLAVPPKSRDDDELQGVVEVHYRSAPGALVVELSDRGRGFDWIGKRAELETPLDPTVPCETGRGLRLAQALVDEFDLVSNPGKGTKVRLLKRIPPRWAIGTPNG